MTPLESIGTPAERWAAAELDVLLDRVTARELWELGREMFGAIQRDADERVTDATETVKHMATELEGTEADLKRVREHRDNLQEKLDTIKRAVQ